MFFNSPLTHFSWGNPSFLFVVVSHLLNHIQHFVTPWIAARQAPLSFTISWSLLKLMFTEWVIPFNHLILLPTVLPRMRVFASGLVLRIREPKYWSFSMRSFNEYSGSIPFRIEWFDLLAVQETLKSLFQHHSSKVSILCHSAFFIVQLSHPYMTTGKTIALTIWTFVGKVISLLFNMLSWFVIAFVFFPITTC